MKNQTLTALLAIQRNIENNRKDNNSFSDILGINKTQIAYLATKFTLAEDEALILAAYCIRGIEAPSHAINIEDISLVLEVNKIEVLQYQKQINTLVEKGFLVEFQKPINRNSVNAKSPIELLNKEFNIHANLGEHLS